MVVLRREDFEALRKVLENDEIPAAGWLVGAELNYAEHVFRNA